MAKNGLKSTFGYMGRVPFQAIAAIFVLSVTFFVVTIVAVLTYSSSKTLGYFETRPQIIAFLKSDAESREIDVLRLRLETDPRLTEVKYVTKEEALAIYKDATSDNPLLGELVSPSVFPASLEFSLIDLTLAEEVIAEVKAEAIVDQVGFTANVGGEENLGDVVGRLRTVVMYVKVGGGVFAGLLILVSVIVLLTIISLRLTVRREEISILNLLGATKSYIRSPILIEALIYTTVGVFLGWLVCLIVWLYLAPTAVSYFGEIPVLPRDPYHFFALFGVILAVEFVIGTIIALLGSSIAVSRSLKKK